MLWHVRHTVVVIGIVVIACAKDPFAPLLDACTDEMNHVRTMYPGAPTGIQRLTLPDGRRVIVWGLPTQQGPGLSPTSMAFIWSADTPQTCLVCIPGSPRCPASTVTFQSSVRHARAA